MSDRKKSGQKKNKNPELSIIITAYKTPALLDMCIKSIKKNIGSLSYEVIVSDGETQSDTRDLMKTKYPDLTFLPHEKNVGFAVSVNDGLNISKGDYLFVINADIVFKNDVMKQLVDYLKRHRDVGMVGPRLINFDGSHQQSYFRFYTPMTVIYRRTFLGKFGFAKRHLNRFNMEDKRGENESIEADWLMGSAMMMPRSVFEKVGFIDTRYFMYFEDTDWCWEVWKSGHRVVYYPKAIAYHYHGKASASKGNIIKAIIVNKYTRIHISSAIKFFAKHLWQKNPHLEYDNNHKIK